MRIGLSKRKDNRQSAGVVRLCAAGFAAIVMGIWLMSFALMGEALACGDPPGHGCPPCHEPDGSGHCIDECGCACLGCDLETNSCYDNCTGGADVLCCCPVGLCYNLHEKACCETDLCDLDKCQECVNGECVNRCNPDLCEECDGQGNCEFCGGRLDETCCDGTCCGPDECCGNGECKDCCKTESTGNCEQWNSECGCDPIGWEDCTGNRKEWTIGVAHYCYSECEGWPCNYRLVDVPCYAWQACNEGWANYDSVCIDGGCRYTIAGYCEECDPTGPATVEEQQDCQCQ